MQAQQDINIRIARLQKLIVEQGLDAILVATTVNTLYLSGEIYQGLLVVPASGSPIHLVRRPQQLCGSSSRLTNAHPIRKVEQLSGCVDTTKWQRIGLELDELSYSEVLRLQKLVPEAEYISCSLMLRTARMIKSPLEIERIRQTARCHIEVYKQIPSLYKQGMTDLDLQIEIERAMRLGGSTGIFRTYGATMEIFMGSLIAGGNAEEPSVYDFAMGGAGSPALPLGANGTKLQEGMSVMIDMAGNYSEYLSDMTRTFSVGKLSDEAYRLHELSRQMHREIMDKARPGTSCSELYNASLAMAEEAGALPHFMGTKQQAQFVGHGLGLQINELPVLTGRSRDVLQTGMVIAYEPKFVLPNIGAVGVENTYLVTENGVENLTPLTEEIIDLSAHA